MNIRNFNLSNFWKCLTILQPNFQNIKIKNDLNLSYNEITELPEDFYKIGRDVNLPGNKLEQLP